MLLGSCTDEIEMRRPPKFELPELPVVEDVSEPVKKSNLMYLERV